MSEYRTAEYIGVSGVVSPEQEADLVEFARETFEGTDAILMLGVKAVHKTQWLDIENKYGPEWYPVGEAAFANVLKPVNGENCAQIYLDPETLRSDPTYGTEFIRQIKRRGASWLHALQFDLLPYQDTPEALSYLVHEAARDVDYREYQVIVQCHAEAMAEGPKLAIEKLKRLSADEISWVLFDASHGKGLQMDVDALKRYLEVAFDDEDLRGVGFGVAGGLNAAVIESELPKLLKDFPNLSWDAEGQLHKTGSGTLDMGATKAYLRASAEVLRSL